LERVQDLKDALLIAIGYPEWGVVQKREVEQRVRRRRRVGGSLERDQHTPQAPEVRVVLDPIRFQGGRLAVIVGDRAGPLLAADGGRVEGQHLDVHVPIRQSAKVGAFRADPVHQDPIEPFLELVQGEDGIRGVTGATLLIAAAVPGVGAG